MQPGTIGGELDAECQRTPPPPSPTLQTWTKFSADAATESQDPEFMLSAIWAKLAAWKNKVR